MSNSSKTGKTTTVLLIAVVFVAAVLAVYLLFFNTSAKYDKLVKNADKEFMIENFESAKNLYRDALEIKPGEEYPRQQIVLIDKKMDEIEQMMIYNEKIEQADLLFDEGNYESARDYYFEALNINSDDEYPVDRIKRIQELLTKAGEKPEKPESGSALDESKKYYHVVVGVFDRNDFAQRLNKKLLDDGIDSKILERKNLNMQAVTYGSFESIHSAYNMMKHVKKDLFPEAWVLYQ
jgi:tetratricopeptide (TPR) repeat protein